MSTTEYLDDSLNPQVLYLGRWVDRENFRVYVYNNETEKLANSYQEYSDLIASGLWFATKDGVRENEPISIKRGRKPKHGANS